MSRYTDWTSGEPVEKEWAMTGPTDPALRAAAQVVVDFYDIWHRGEDGGYEWWNVIDPLRAALAAAEAAPLDVERPCPDDVTEGRERLWKRFTSGEKLAYGCGYRDGRSAALRSPDTETAGEAERDAYLAEVEE